MSAKVPRGARRLPPEVRFGAGAARELPAICREVGADRPLLVTDGGLARSSIVEGALRRAREAGLEPHLFSGIEGNPSGPQIEAGLRAYRRSGCEGVLAIGGGSALDAGKAIAFGLAQDRPLWDFALGEPGGAPAARPGAPWIAVPTTSGTGSELSPSAVITNPEDGRKRSICHPSMRARRVVCDPALTIGLPPDLTAWVGMDALSHNLEAFLSPVSGAGADAAALEALAAIARWLEPAARDGADLEARAEMLCASSLGAIAFENGCGGVHALSHPLSARYGTHHGLANAILLPYVVAESRAACEEKLRELAAAAALPCPSADALLTWLLELRAALGIPPTLYDLGLRPPADLDALCRAAAADANAPTSPVPLTRERLARLYRQAWTGRRWRRGARGL